MRPSLLMIALAAVLAGPGAAAERFNWNALGTEFCKLTLTGDMTGMPVILTPSLTALLRAAAANPAMPPARTLFQAYVNPVTECRVQTRSAALVDVTRSNAGGAEPSWTDYLVVVPERDGTTRIDDIIFTTRDTLRGRLEGYAQGR
jgi:hypothetical protein